MVKVKDIFLWAGGSLALIGSVWLGLIAAARGHARRRGPAVMDAAAGGTLGDLAAQFVEAAERAMGELDRRSDELRLLLGKAEDRLAAIREARPIEARPTDATTAEPGGPARESLPRTATAAFGADPENNLKDRFAVVYGLADQGLPVDEIAGKVKMTKGEVALIMGLRKAR